MDFLDKIILVSVFLIVSIYFGIQFVNSIKIHDCIKNESNNIDIFKKINKLCQINIVSYCVAYILLTAIYFLITKASGLSISIVGFSIFIIIYSLYSVAISNVDNISKIKMYKLYNSVNFLLHIMMCIIPITVLFIIYLS